MKPKKQILIAAGAAVVIMVFAWYQVVWTGQTKSVGKAEAAAAAARTSAAQFTTKANALQKQKADAGRAALLQKLDAAVPADPGLPTYLRWLADLADQSHLTVPTVGHTTPALVSGAAAPAPAAGGAAPAPAADSGALYVITLNISASGTYGDILEFVHKLETNQRLIIVDTVGISGGGTSSEAAPADPAATGGQTSGTTAVSVATDPSMSLTLAARMFSTNAFDGATTTGVKA